MTCTVRTISRHPTETLLTACYVCSPPTCLRVPPSDLEGTRGPSSGMTHATVTGDSRAVSEGGPRDPVPTSSFCSRVQQG